MQYNQPFLSTYTAGPLTSKSPFCVAMYVLLKFRQCTFQGKFAIRILSSKPKVSVKLKLAMKKGATCLPDLTVFHDLCYQIKAQHPSADSNIVSAQIRATSGTCGFSIYRMWAGSMLLSGKAQKTEVFRDLIDEMRITINVFGLLHLEQMSQLWYWTPLCPLLLLSLQRFLTINRIRPSHI